MKKQTLGLMLVLSGITVMVGQAVANDASQVAPGIDTRTVVSILCGMLTAVIGLYMRSLSEEVKKKASAEIVAAIAAKADKKADSDMVGLLVAQINKTQEALAENLSQLNQRMHSHATKLHEVQLVIASQHPTKRDLQDAVVAALAPVVVRLDSLEEKIDEFNARGD